MSQAEVTHYTATERLRDECPVTIRAIRPEDRGLVTEALRNVGEESRRLRFFSGKSRFTETKLRTAQPTMAGAKSDARRS